MSELTIVGYGPADSTDVLTIRRTAAVNLSGRRAVTPRDDETIEYADQATAGHLQRPVWLTLGAIVAAETDDVAALGRINEPTWSWTVGQAIYLGANGVLTQSPPLAPVADFLLEIARVIDPQTIWFEPKMPIRLS
jgi:hypothetical protein